MIDAFVRARLVATPAVVALVDPGSISCGGEIPEGRPHPAIAIVASSLPETDLGGVAAITKTTVEVWTLAPGDATRGGLARVREIAAAVAAALDCYRGTWGGTEIQGVFLTETEDAEPDPESGLSAVTQTFVVWHR